MEKLHFIGEEIGAEEFVSFHMCKQRMRLFVLEIYIMLFGHIFFPMILPKTLIV